MAEDFFEKYLDVLGATELKEDEFLSGKVLSEVYHSEIKYAWDNGKAIGRYLAELKNGRIIARECRKCRRIMLPPRMFCELCWRTTDRWVYVKDTGTVNTFSISYILWNAQRLDKPIIPAVIEIDGASKGEGILHLIGEVDPNEVYIGMKVKAVWKKPEERTGSITDILYFKPIK